MKTIRSVALASAVILVLSQAASFRAAGPEKRPIELADIMAWKGIDSPTLSEDGAWFAYRLTPGEGDGDVIFRETKGEKHFQFSIGEQPESAGARGGGGQRGQGQVRPGHRDSRRRQGPLGAIRCGGDLARRSDAARQSIRQRVHVPERHGSHRHRRVAWHDHAVQRVGRDLAEPAKNTGIETGDR